jgi:hypothetical protein
LLEEPKLVAVHVVSCPPAGISRGAEGAAHDSVNLGIR